MLQILSKKDKLTARLVQDQYYPPYKLQNDVVELNAQKRVYQELQ